MGNTEMLFFASKVHFGDAQKAFESEHGNLASWNTGGPVVVKVPRKKGKGKVKKKFWGVKLINLKNWVLFRDFVEQNWNIDGNEVKGRREDAST